MSTVQHWLADPSTSPYCGGCGWPNYGPNAVTDFSGPEWDEPISVIEQHVRDSNRRFALEAEEVYEAVIEDLRDGI
jgi:hypothetical protein